MQRELGTILRCFKIAGFSEDDSLCVRVYVRDRAWYVCLYGEIIPELKLGNYRPYRCTSHALSHLYLGPGFDTRSGNILSFLLPLFQEGQLSVTGESMCTKYWLTA